MDRYQRVEKPREEAPISENEIRVTTQGRTRNYITYATGLLQDKGSNEIVLRAMGRAISKTVMLAELIKGRIAGLHQNTSIASADITDVWEPLEEGLHPVETTRHVSMITITLSKTELDTSSSGYQLPIPVDQVKPIMGPEFEEDMPYPSRGRGHRTRGRGGRGTSNRMADHNGDGGYVYGRREGGRDFRGNERGYAGGDMHYESAGYYDAGQEAPPLQRRGRGRGRGGVRRRGRG